MKRGSKIIKNKRENNQKLRKLGKVINKGGKIFKRIKL